VRMGRLKGRNAIIGKGVTWMGSLRSVVCCMSLLLAVAPVAAFADEAPSHSQAELANAQAQLQLAQQQANMFADQAAQSAANERMIALLKSEALRQTQLDNTANGRALDQLAAALADAIRGQGDANARNELAILQIKAGALLAKADANVANAFAIGRADEIANAQAQSAALHQLADYLTGTLAQQNMSNAQVIAGDAAASVETAAVAESQNDEAMGANDLLAADTILNASEVAVESSTEHGQAQADALLAHAEASLANAEAMAAEAP
jgi:hypothetical protein